ncbi:MAG: sulfurtransferase TusA family protein [Thermodesulfovibrionales bacterium]|jgi:TusA-related sulfurtransferase
MLIDARGLKHPETLQKLREMCPTFCSLDEYIELLVDDEYALRQIKKYAAISGCEYEIQKQDASYTIRIKSSCL